MAAPTNTLNNARKFPSGDFRAIQLHPTLRCNLRCQHCYSSSAPHLKDSVLGAQVITFLEYARTYDFNMLSLSGGEPLLYKELLPVLKAGKSLGYHTAMASNGMLLKSARAQQVLEQVDLVAISIDGTEALHDEIRQFQGAYQRMLEGVALLREQDKNFGFIHTITPRSWAGLIDLADLAYAQGARLLQLHPLELNGRAQLEMAGQGLDQILLHKVFILTNYLKKKYAGVMTIQLDFLHRSHLLAHPSVANYYGENFQPTKAQLADALGNVIVDEIGDIYPFSYGFSKQYKIGTLAEVAQGVDVFERYLQRFQGAYSVLKNTYHELVEQEEKDLLIWTERIVHNSYQTVP